MRVESSEWIMPEFVDCLLYFLSCNTSPYKEKEFWVWSLLSHWKEEEYGGFEDLDVFSEGRGREEARVSSTG